MSVDAMGFSGVLGSGASSPKDIRSVVQYSQVGGVHAPGIAANVIEVLIYGKRADEKHPRPSVRGDLFAFNLELRVAVFSSVKVANPALAFDMDVLEKSPLFFAVNSSAA